MKVTSLGYDPDLGRKFSVESSGLVIGRAKSLPRKSEAQVRQDWIEEHGREPDAQQLHDAMLSTSCSPTPEELEEMASRRRWTVGRNQGLAEQASKESQTKSR
ncbi:MAG: hypothetical protein WAW69_04395 [Polaromonas sp.]